MSDLGEFLALLGFIACCLTAAALPDLVAWVKKR